MYAIRYDWKNCVGFVINPTSDSNASTPPASRNRR